MKRHLAIAVLIGTIVTVGGFSLLNADDQKSSATPSASKEAKIRRLLDTMQAGDMGKQVMDRMISTFRRLPDLPPGFIDEFQKSVDAQELVDLTVPIYDKYLTEADVDGLLEFYNSPVGKKFVSVQGALMQEAMMAGEQWGQRKAMEVVRKLQAQKQDDKKKDIPQG